VKNIWVDSDLLSNKSGIGRDSKSMLIRLNSYFNLEIISWPDILPVNFKHRRTLLIAARLFLGARFKLPRTYRGGFYQSQLGALVPGNNITTWVIRLHDLFPATHPEWFHSWAVKIFKSSLDLAVRRNAIFLCDSKSTQNELRRLYPNTKILSFLIPCLLPDDPKIKCNQCSVCAHLMSTNSCKFFLSVGTVEPRKNYSMAIRAWKKLSNRKDFDFQLIIVGRKGWKSKGMQSTLLNSRHLGINWFYDCCDGALEELYAKCEGLISFSHAEGFDLPPMEVRQRHSKPLILSDIDVHREFHENVAHFFRDEGSLINILLKPIRPSFVSNYETASSKNLIKALEFIKSTL
jgi:glycosyltransferase involved in cell wall biosynthesis